MIPIDIELFKTLVPIMVVLGGLVLFLWSKVEHPLRTHQLNASADEAFKIVRETIHRKGFVRLEEDVEARTIKIKGILKIVDVILYRCWSKEIMFHIVDLDSKSKLVVTCKLSPFRITASSSNPNYLSRGSFDGVLDEVDASLKNKEKSPAPSEAPTGSA